MWLITIAFAIIAIIYVIYKCCKCRKTKSQESDESTNIENEAIEETMELKPTAEKEEAKEETPLGPIPGIRKRAASTNKKPADDETPRKIRSVEDIEGR